MIAIDTNLLVYAHRRDVPEHRAAKRALERAADGPSGWGMALPILGEFWSVVTHPRAAGRPSKPSEAAAFLRSLGDPGGMLLWLPRPGFAERLLRLTVDLGVVGMRIFDLQIALTALENGAHELWTHDDGFVTLPGLRVRDPLQG